MNTPFFKEPKGYPSKLEDPTELSEKGQKNRKKKDTKKNNHSELSGGDVLSGNVMPGLFLSGASAGVGDRYTMSKKEEMEALLLSRNGRRALQVADSQKLL
eukprot:14350031-Ditylum_brightwellii.AAC.1